MRKENYVKPYIKVKELDDELMQFTETSSTTIGSHEEGGGEVLSKPNSFDNSGSKTNLWSEE